MDPRIAELLADVEKKWGRGALVRLGDAVDQANVEVIPTGAPTLDAALGIGGLPCGRISEIFGPDSSGKQSLAAQLAVQCQQSDGAVVYIDMGGRLDPDQMRAQGVDFDSMMVARPADQLQGLEMAIRLARNGEVKLLLLDLADSSRSSAIRPVNMPSDTFTLSHREMGIPPLPKGEAARRAGEGPLPLNTRQLALRTQNPNPKTSLGMALRRLVSAVDRNGVAFVFITDTPPQEQHDPTRAAPHASPPPHLCCHPAVGAGVPNRPFQPGQARALKSSGGSALRFFASVRLRVERQEWIRRGRDVMGCRSLIQVAKNKLAPPLREAEVELIFYRFPPEAPAMSLCRPARQTGAECWVPRKQTSA